MPAKKPAITPAPPIAKVKPRVKKVVNLPPAAPVTKPARRALTDTQREVMTIGRETRKTAEVEHAQKRKTVQATGTVQRRTERARHEQSLAQTEASKQAKRSVITHAGRTKYVTETNIARERAEARVYQSGIIEQQKREQRVEAAREIEGARTSAYYKRHVGAPIATAAGRASASIINPFALVFFTMIGLIFVYIMVTHGEDFAGFLGAVSDFLGKISRVTPLFINTGPKET